MIAPSHSTVDYHGLQLATHFWKASTPTLKLLLINHGLSEHGARYHTVAQYFCEAGYDVVSWDHQGHGESDGARGTIRSLDDLVGESRAVLAAFNSPRYRHRVTWGQSMGALLTLASLRDVAFQQQLSAVLVTAPALALAFEPPALLVKLAGVASRLLPNLTKDNGLELAALSRIPSVITAYEADPLVQRRLSMRLAHAFLALPKELLAAPTDLRTPLLLMHGDADRICDVQGSRDYVALNSGADVTLKEWPGAYHELHNEPERGEVLAFAKTFFDRHTT